MGLPEKSTPPEAYSLSQVPTDREPVPPPDWPAESASFLPPAHYVVLEALGNGGMGVLYKAEDTRLHRTVALKVLPLRFTNDPVAKERFLREARTASALDHQNICAIFDVGESADGRLFLAMPCYQGETLRSRLARGPLGLEEALGIAKQIARGLAKAHRLGIVHRDIKPENLMLTTEGVVKILDFGIAKLSGSSDLTGTEHRIGTPSYMAPEQSRKGTVDSRADLWALGVVLYEMLTGRRPFGGANPLAVLQAIQYGVPEPISQLRPGVPSRLEKVVARLLMKNPKARYPDAESVLADLDGETAAAGKRSRRVWLAAGIAAAAGLGLFASALLESGDGSTDGIVPVRFTSRTLTSQSGGEWYPSLSRDAERVVYARWDGLDYDLFLQDVPSGAPVNLTAGFSGNDTHPAFSPDGAQIAFRSERAGGGIFLMNVDEAGRPVRRLTDFGYHPAWSPDGREILVSTEAITDPTVRGRSSRVWGIDTESGRKRLLLDRDAVQPSWSPNGKRIAYWSVLAKDGRRVIWTVSADGSSPIAVRPNRSIDWNPVWSSDGYLYFVSDRGGAMSPWRIAIDEDTGLTPGEPEPILAPSGWSGFLNLSHDGRLLVYSTSGTTSLVERSELGADGVPAPLRRVTGVSMGLLTVRVSPGGDQLVLSDASDDNQEDLFLARTDGAGDLIQITRDEHRDRSPSWLADGRIVFSSNRSGRYELWTIASGGGAPRPLGVSHNESLFSPVASPDGSWLACIAGLAKGMLIGRDRTLVPLPPLDGLPFVASSWSPDSRSLAGVLNGRPGIVLYSPESRRYEKLTESGWRPVWTPDGSKILFLDKGWKVFSLDLATRETREILAPPPGFAFVDMDLDPTRGLLYLVSQQPEGNVMMLALE